jgi:hypothetical protein
MARSHRSRRSKSPKRSRRVKRSRSGGSRKRKLSGFQKYMSSHLKKAGMKGKSRSARTAIFKRVAKGWKGSR